MANIAHNLYAAIAATLTLDAQELLIATKQTASLHLTDPDWNDDAVNATLRVLRREAEERIEYGDDPDPMLYDVIACIDEYHA